jgi:hypothetical protein
VLLVDELGTMVPMAASRFSEFEGGRDDPGATGGTPGVVA